MRIATALLIGTILTGASPGWGSEPATAPETGSVSEDSSTLGWKSVAGIPLAAIGGLVLVGSAVALLAGAVVLTTPSDTEQSIGPALVGVGLLGGGVGAGVVAGGGALIAWDLNDGE